MEPMGWGRVVRLCIIFWKHVQLDYEKKTVGAWSY